MTDLISRGWWTSFCAGVADLFRVGVAGFLRIGKCERGLGRAYSAGASATVTVVDCVSRPASLNTVNWTAWLPAELNDVV